MRFGEWVKYIRGTVRLIRGAYAVGIPEDISGRRLSVYEVPNELGDHLYRGSLARAVKREIGSLVGRIKEILRSRSYRRGVTLDPLFQTTATPEQRRQAQDACNADMQRLFDRRSWLTLEDIRIFALAWRLGAEWVYRSGNRELLLSEHAPSGKSRRKFTLNNSAIPQDSKRGQSTPPASQESAC